MVSIGEVGRRCGALSLGGMWSAQMVHLLTAGFNWISFIFIFFGVLLARSLRVWVVWSYGTESLRGISTFGFLMTSNLDIPIQSIICHMFHPYFSD